jgi:ElaB/YqjD/DUF883 family membrane-anchored ribosome-binding protein
MATSTEQSMEELRKEIAALKSDLGDIAETIRRISGEAVGQGREQIKEKARRSRDQASEAWHAVEHEISERPATSLVAAFSVGFIVGRLLDR